MRSVPALIRPKIREIFTARGVAHARLAIDDDESEAVFLVSVHDKGNIDIGPPPDADGVKVVTDDLNGIARQIMEVLSHRKVAVVSDEHWEDVPAEDV